jgi:hypothetical protein
MSKLTPNTRAFRRHPMGSAFLFPRAIRRFNAV